MMCLRSSILSPLLVTFLLPVKIFINQKNTFTDKTDEYGLQNSNGLWTCIIPMDIDNDGDEDFLLGNLAPNTQFKASEKEPSDFMCQ